MAIYVRFQSDVRYSDQHWPPLGLFHAAGKLQDDNDVQRELAYSLEDALSWFDCNLFRPKLVAQHRRCVFWFRAGRSEYLSRARLLAAMLRQHAIAIREVESADPGAIVYRDEHQIAAVPSQRILKALRV